MNLKIMKKRKEKKKDTLIERKRETHDIHVTLWSVAQNWNEMSLDTFNSHHSNFYPSLSFPMQSHGWTEGS